MSTQLYSHYSDLESAHRSRLRRLSQKGHAFLVGEVSLFSGSLLLLVLWGMGYGRPWSAFLAVAAFVAYLIVRVADSRNETEKERQRRLCDVYHAEQQYLDGDFSAFGDGREYVDANHPFSFDLDLFGPQSFFHRINRTVTSGGRDLLAHWLGTLPDNRDAILKRQQSVERLSRLADDRARFMACHRGEPLDTRQVTAAVEAAVRFPVPAWVRSPWTMAVARLCLLAFYVLILLAVLTPWVSANVPVMVGLLLFVCVFGSTSSALKGVSKIIGRLEKPMKGYAGLAHVMASTPLHDIEDTEFRRAFDVQGTAVDDAISRLAGLTGTLDSRGNAVFAFLADTFALHGLVTLRSFARWQSRCADGLRDSIQAVSVLDALISLATFRYNEPQTVWPELADGDADGRPAVAFEGKDLRHPFLGEKAVGNDFSLSNGHFYIVTGANMAGKSTFLRTVGLTCVMAFNGLPVMAKKLRLSLFNLFTSMRTSDDLSRGISYFNAELLRLQQLIEACKQSDRPTLIILDEILKGTNSLDKLNGSRLFLEYISQLSVTGIIATHDLELSRMEEQHPDRFHNYCFEIKLGSDITYTYYIAPGVARNQNATFLLKQMLDGKNE